jgi:hypothetical protein
MHLVEVAPLESERFCRPFLRNGEVGRDEARDTVPYFPLVLIGANECSSVDLAACVAVGEPEVAAAERAGEELDEARLHGAVG